jgi:predicted Zn-ribbon and HTH transcriptional regulator
MLNRQGYYVKERERECTNCGNIFPKTSKTVTLCNSCNSERVKAWKTPEYSLWARAKSRCKKSGLEFTIEISDISIPENCPYLDIPLKKHKGSPGGKPESPALDRIANSKGYIKSNIQVISHLANQMKASASKEQLVLFSTRILEIFGKE